MVNKEENNKIHKAVVVDEETDDEGLEEGSYSSDEGLEEGSDSSHVGFEEGSDTETNTKTKTVLNTRVIYCGVGASSNTPDSGHDDLTKLDELRF